MAYDPDPKAHMFSDLQYCTRCGMPSTELESTFDEMGVCAGCGGEERMGRISKQVDQYLRWLLVAGAMSVIRPARR